MPNKNKGNPIYRKGRRKEYQITEDLKKEGWDIAQRSKGSHSPIDVFAINKEEKKILLVQAKPNDFPESKTNKILSDNADLSGAFMVEFAVM